MKHHPISGCSHKKSVTILRNCFSLSKICNTQLDGYHGNYRHHPKIKYEYFLPQPSISGYKSTGSYIYVNNSAGRNSCERLQPIESPFLHCRTPIVRIWNGWSFLNYTQDRNSHVRLQSIKSIDCLETHLQSSALLNYMNDPRLLNNNERHTISLMVNKGMSPLGCHSNDKPTSAQLSFVLFKLRDELPQFFYGDHSFHIYEQNLLFQNNLLPISWTIRSRLVYKSFLMLSRFLISWWYSQAQLDLIKITKEIDTGEIQARWRIRGSPRLLPWRSKRVIVEVFSIFTINKTGKICIHKMDKMMPSPKNKNKVLVWLAQLGFFLGLIRRPSGEFEPQTSTEGFLMNDTCRKKMICCVLK